jgi:SAM-dependent methyltransferase
MNDDKLADDLRALSIALDRRIELASMASAADPLPASMARLDGLPTLARVDELPIGETRLVRVKRGIVRVLRISTDRQAHVNKELIDVCRTLASQLEQVQFSVDQERANAAAARATTDVLLEELDRTTHVESAAISRISQRLEQMSAVAVDANEQLGRLTNRVDALDERLGIARVEQLERVAEELATLKTSVGDETARGQRTRAAVTVLEATLQRLVEDIRILVPPRIDVGTAVATAGAIDELDEVDYRTFEDLQRGSVEEIRAGLAHYLPDVTARRDLGGPIVDIGCGRGEWLGLLADEGIEAIGVDVNPSQAADAKDRGLDIVIGDGFEYLAEAEPRSLLGVTAFHVLEHVPVALQHRFFQLAMRAVKPGGIVIVETPNPTNLIVGAAAFYLDATHLRPIHPDYLEYLAREAGFVGIEVRFLHPREQYNVLGPSNDPVAEDLRWALYGPQDFAVIARRPPDAP